VTADIELNSDSVKKGGKTERKSRKKNLIIVDGSMLVRRIAVEQMKEGFNGKYRERDSGAIVLTYGLTCGG